MNGLFDQSLVVTNAGLESFAKNIEHAGGEVNHLQWQPPALGQKEAGLLLAQTINHPLVEEANQIAVERYLAAQPVLIDVKLAKDAIPALSNQKHILHAGPPIVWKEMAGPVQGAILGAILLEGWAANLDEAEQLVHDKIVTYEPNHHHDAVGPMAGIISPSMPVWVIQNKTNGLYTFSNFNEGLGKVLRFGAHNEEVLDRLRWIASDLAPAIQAALKITGEIEIKPMMAQALHMGDEVHNRNAAATGLLIKKLMPALIQLDIPKDRLEKIVTFLTSNDHFFLNLSMAACKAMMNAAADIPYSSVVTVMARNGVNFGIQLSGTKKQWFQAPANPVEGLFFPGYSVEDAAADLGDSAITETAGVGGFAMASSPAIVKFVGGTPADAIQNSIRMQYITLTGNPAFTLPALNFAPTAACIDARKVVDRNILPIINTGIAHKKAGIGQIGAGITTAPMEGFIEAICTLANELTIDNQ